MRSTLTTLHSLRIDDHRKVPAVGVVQTLRGGRSSHPGNIVGDHKVIGVLKDLIKTSASSTERSADVVVEPAEDDVHQCEAKGRESRMWCAVADHEEVESHQGESGEEPDGPED